MSKPEYRVRPVTRYVVTMHGECATSVVGEFTDHFYAKNVADALSAYDAPPAEIVQAKRLGVLEMLRNVVSSLESGEIRADIGVLTVRAADQKRPVVFGLGEAVADPYYEMELAAKELDRLQR